MERGVFSTEFAGDFNAGNQVGVNTGSITNHFHPDTQSSKPSPSIIVPFRRDRHFVPRSILDQIWSCAAQPAARVGIFGLGGVGKTQLAVEYAYRQKEAHPQTWVFWVHASSRARFEESYTQIARQVHIWNTSDPKADTLAMVYTWLSDERNGPWTMVVDNADSDTVMFGSSDGEGSTSTSTHPSSNPSLAHLLPTAAHGSIVITSRSRAVLNGLIEYTTDIFELGLMTETDAVTLLEMKLTPSTSPVDQADLARLAENLEYMPLALSQAVGYINRLAPRMTVSKYLTQLTSSNLDRDRLLQLELRDPRRDEPVSNSIIYTWHRSFEHIRHTRNSAARLMSLMSMFNRESIPEKLLHGTYQSVACFPPSVQDIANDGSIADLEFEKDIGTLCDYNLIRFGSGEMLFGLHRLVQVSTQEWLEVRGELGYWQERCVSVLDAIVPSIADPANWPECEALSPHIEALVSHSLLRNHSMLQRANILERGVRHAAYRCRYDSAKRLAMACLDDRTKILGPVAEQTLSAQIAVANVIRRQGEYEGAQELCRRVLQLLESNFGIYHEKTIGCLETLAAVLSGMGQFEEAEQNLRRLVEVSQEKFGTDHGRTIHLTTQLSLVLYYSAKYSEAESLCRKGVGRQELQLGPKNQHTLWSKCVLALNLARLAKIEEAIDLLRQVLKDCEDVLGIRHYTTLTAMGILNQILTENKRYREAVRLSDRALPLYLEIFGQNHPDTRSCQYWRIKALAQVEKEGSSITIASDSVRR